MSTDHHPPRPGTLDAVLDDVWRRLERGARDRRHGFRLPSIATADDAGRPSGRTVVLRSVDRATREIACFSDARSAKIDHLTAQPWTAWTFWDHRSQVQLRVEGPAVVHAPEDDARAAHAWDSMDPRSRRPWFAEAAPGLDLPAAGDGLPADLDVQAPSAEQLARARSAFRRVAVVAQRMDWLSLRGEHRRARFTWNADAVTSSWCRP